VFRDHKVEIFKSRNGAPHYLRGRPVATEIDDVMVQFKDGKGSACGLHVDSIMQIHNDTESEHHIAIIPCA